MTAWKLAWGLPDIATTMQVEFQVFKYIYKVQV